MTDPTLSLATWNIHRGRGADGRVDPARVLGVVRDDIAPRATDALILQEADAEARPHRAVLACDALENASGLVCVHDARHRLWGADSLGFLGVVVLLRRGIAVQDVTLLDLPGHCHRGAVVVDARIDDCPFRLIGAHLSLGQPARIAQMRVIGQHLTRRDPRPAILAGDLNEWRPWGGIALSRGLLGHAFSGPVRRSFPVRRPVLPLDRVLAAHGARVLSAEALDGPAIRAASDHRPLAARVAIDPG